MGFASVKQFAEADAAGRTFVSHFRKAYPATSAGTNFWLDTTMYGGGPPANYYASTPLTAATLNGNRAFYVGDDKAPAARYLTHFGLVGSSANNRGQYILQDYLLYYPFIDCDDLTEQVMDNSTTLPRYTDGAGVMVMAIAQSNPTGSGTFTFTYVNQDGVAKTSPAQACPVGATALTSNLLGWIGSVANGPHYCTLASGDSGVRRITGCTFSVANGGLMALVLVRPLADVALREGSVQVEKEFISRAPGAPRVYDGAYLGMIAYLVAGQSNSQVTGYLRFAWDEGV